MEAEETELQCFRCSHVVHVYALKGPWSRRFCCPNCQADYTVSPAPQEAPSSDTAAAA